MVKTFLKSLLVIILVALGITAAMQAVTSVYKFSAARQFSGETIYNPYVGIDSTQWRKANFHAHQRYMLFGLDFDYTSEQFLDAYREKGYDIIGLADHQQINENGHIPTYEHGIGLNNYHLLMVGAESVSWFDYPIMLLPQHQMQYQLDKFKSQVKLLGMNHPSRHRHVKVEVFENLMGYDLMEMNPDLNSTAWDVALSSGIYSTLMSNDDAHTIFDRERWFQRAFTVVNTPTLDDSDIIASLKAGRAYGVVITAEQNKQENPHMGLPTLRNVEFVNDSIRIALSTSADSIRFIGQDSQTLKTDIATDSTYYKFAQTDTYVRAEAFFADGTQLWINPFRRTGGSVRETATINSLLTTLNAVGWGFVTLVFVWLIILVLRRRRPSNNYYR